MAYSDNFPATRPVFQADFANGGKIDPRATFSRSDTPPTYAAPSAVHYWSNEKHLSSDNLLLQSSDFDTTWTVEFLDLTDSQTDPAGGTNGWTIEERATTSYHRLIQSISSGSADYGLVFYAKQNTGTRYLTLALVTGNNNYEAATFDLAGGSPVRSSGSSSSFTSVSATQTLSGNGYYKCVLKATGSPVDARISLVNSSSPTLTGYGSYAYAGDGTSSIDIAFASLSTTGATDYNATTTQIHREYAPTLKSVATAGQPRFEYDPSTDGQSMGILIEGQSTNLLNYSEQFDNAYWSKSTGGTSPAINLTITPNAGIAPSGELTADLVVPQNTGGNTVYYIAKNYSFTSGDTYTLSVYVKSAGHTEIALQAGNPATWAASTRFTLTGDGSASVSSGSAQIEKCGNGWFRLSVTGTAGATASTNLLLQFYSSGQSSFDGDDYSGVLLWGAMFEQASHSSSYLKVEGSTVTRAAESLSVDTADIPGFSEGVGTVVYETGGVASATETNQLGFGLRADSANFFTAGVNNGGVTDASVRVYSKTSDGDQAFLNPGTATVGTGYKLACRFELDNIAASMNGGTVVSDTSGKVPVGVDTLWVGQLAGNYYLNSNLKRIAIYNEALSDTNLQALTS